MTTDKQNNMNVSKNNYSGENPDHKKHIQCNSNYMKI